MARLSSRTSNAGSLIRCASPPGGPRPGAAADLGPSHPGAQRLGVDAQLASDPANPRPLDLSGSRQASTATRAARSRTSSGYFPGALITANLP